MRIISLLMLLLLAACGYHTPGAVDDWAGGESRVLYVELFENQTAEPYLENYLTDALLFELAKSRLVELTEDQDKANVRLVGSVTKFSSNASAYRDADRISDYRATMKVSARLVSVGDNQVLWQDNLSRREHYLATVDKNLQLDGEAFAAKRVAKRLAEDLYAGLLNNF